MRIRFSVSVAFLVVLFSLASERGTRSCAVSDALILRGYGAGRQRLKRWPSPLLLFDSFAATSVPPRPPRSGTQTSP